MVKIKERKKKRRLRKRKKDENEGDKRRKKREKTKRKVTEVGLKIQNSNAATRHCQEVMISMVTDHADEPKSDPIFC